jgi:undecaprenyl-diphosphatase
MRPFTAAERARMLVVAAALALVLVAVGVATNRIHPPVLDRGAARAATRLTTSRTLEDLPTWLRPREVFRSFAELGSPVAATLATAALALFAWTRRDRAGTLVALLAPVVAFAGAESVAKPLFGRVKHAGGGFTYPSGTVSVTSALAVVALVLLVRYGSRADLRRWAPFAVVVPVLAAIGVVGTHAHYVTDTLGGACFGTAVALTVTALASRAYDAAAVS